MTRQLHCQDCQVCAAIAAESSHSAPPGGPNSKLTSGAGCMCAAPRWPVEAPSKSDSPHGDPARPIATLRQSRQRKPRNRQLPKAARTGRRCRSSPSILHPPMRPIRRTPSAPHAPDPANKGGCIICVAVDTIHHVAARIVISPRRPSTAAIRCFPRPGGADATRARSPAICVPWCQGACTAHASCIVRMVVDTKYQRPQAQQPQPTASTAS